LVGVGVADDGGPEAAGVTKGLIEGVISDIVPALAGAGMKRAARREQEVPANGRCNETLGTVMA
jgi:hypothetical protein